MLTKWCCSVADIKRCQNSVVSYQKQLNWTMNNFHEQIKLSGLLSTVVSSTTPVLNWPEHKSRATMSEWNGRLYCGSISYLFSDSEHHYYHFRSQTNNSYLWGSIVLAETEAPEISQHRWVLMMRFLKKTPRGSF